VKFGTITHHSEGLFYYVRFDIWGPSRLYRLEAIDTLSCLLIIYQGDVGYAYETNI